MFARLFTCSLGFILGTGAALAEPQTIAFVDVHVVTMESDEVWATQTVIVQDDRIVAIGDVDKMDIPANATRIKGHGGYLMPGLIDLHVHIQDETDLELYLLNGVTTVRDCGGSAWTLWKKDRIEANLELGPRLFVSSPPVIGFGEGVAADVLDIEAQKIVDGYAKRGYSFLKIYDRISPEGYQALIRAARRAGIRPIGHIPRNLRLDDVLVNPPDSIEHAEEFLYAEFFRQRSGSKLDPDTIAPVVRKVSDARISIIATLGMYDHIGRQVGDLDAEFREGAVRYASALQRQDWGRDRNRYRHIPSTKAPRFREAFAFQKQFIGACHDAGVPILLGTDSGGGAVPFVIAGFSAHEELVHFVDCGLSPYEAISAATREPARYLGQSDIGTIAPGQLADMILVRGNPLDDVRNAGLQAGVMVRGRWIPSEEITERLKLIAERSRREEEFIQAVKLNGEEGARCVLAESLRDTPSLVPFREYTLNELAYQSFKIDKDVDLAVALFRLNAEMFAESWNVHDSLAEGLIASGDIEAAIRSYENSLAVFPGNIEGREEMLRLRRELENEDESTSP